MAGELKRYAEINVPISLPAQNGGGNAYGQLDRKALLAEGKHRPKAADKSEIPLVRKRSARKVHGGVKSAFLRDFRGPRSIKAGKGIKLPEMLINSRGGESGSKAGRFKPPCLLRMTSGHGHGPSRRRQAERSLRIDHPLCCPLALVHTVTDEWIVIESPTHAPETRSGRPLPL